MENMNGCGLPNFSLHRWEIFLDAQQKEFITKYGLFWY